MDTSLKHIAFVFIFLAFFCLVADINQLSRKKEFIKDSLDISTKAAAQQVDEDPKKISEGIFHIDAVKSKNAYLTLMALNLNTTTQEIDNCTIEWSVINSPCLYKTIATEKTYDIKDPTVIASIRFKFQGVLLRRELIIKNNLAGSRLRSKYKTS